MADLGEGEDLNAVLGVVEGVSPNMEKTIAFQSELRLCAALKKGKINNIVKCVLLVLYAPVLMDSSTQWASEQQSVVIPPFYAHLNHQLHQTVLFLLMLPDCLFRPQTVVAADSPPAPHTPHSPGGRLVRNKVKEVGHQPAT